MAAPSKDRVPEARLDDRYTKRSGSVFLSGNQALVQLPIPPRPIDDAEDLQTAELNPTYCGSPLWGVNLDFSLWYRKRSAVDRFGDMLKHGRNGKIDLGDAPGWGLELDMSRRQRHRVETPKW